MLKLVRSLSDADFDAEDWADRKGIRQVIINTHSPLVVAVLPEDELLMAETLRLKGATFVNFKPLNGTWRDTPNSAASTGTITRGELQSYLDGLSRPAGSPAKRQVRDHLSGDLFHTR